MGAEIISNPLAYVGAGLIAAFIVGLVFRRALPTAVSYSLPAPLIVGVGLLLYAVFNPPEPESPEERLKGELTVPAYQSRGTPFTNYMRFPIEVEFRAEGRWNLTRRPDSARGPAGRAADEPDTRRRLAAAPWGSLIMKRGEDGDYVFAGQHKAVELEPGETVLFLANDYDSDRAYADNTGSLTVYWTCLNCLNR